MRRWRSEQSWLHDAEAGSLRARSGGAAGGRDLQQRRVLQPGREPGPTEMLRPRRRREGLEVAACREEMVQAGWALAGGGECEKAREVAEAILPLFSQEGSGGTGKTPLVEPFPGPCKLTAPPAAG